MCYEVRVPWTMMRDWALVTARSRVSVAVRPWGTRTRIWRGLVTVTRTLARRLRFLVRGALFVVLMAVVWSGGLTKTLLVGFWQYEPSKTKPG